MASTVLRQSTLVGFDRHFLAADRKLIGIRVKTFVWYLLGVVRECRITNVTKKFVFLYDEFYRKKFKVRRNTEFWYPHGHRLHSCEYGAGSFTLATYQHG